MRRNSFRKIPAILSLLLCFALLVLTAPSKAALAADKKGLQGNKNTTAVTSSQEPKLSQLFDQVGNIVTFGTYEQDYDFSNGQEPIEWIVLDTDGEKSLLVSRYALDTKPYNDEFDNDITWEKSTLRAWLNGSFLNAAFPEEAQDAILATGSTRDKVSLLCYSELRKYFGTRMEMLCKATAYAVVTGAYQSPEQENPDTIWSRSYGLIPYKEKPYSYGPENYRETTWWLRDAWNSKANRGSASTAYFVNVEGGTPDGSITAFRSVRPSLWLDLNSNAVKSTSTGRDTPPSFTRVGSVVTYGLYEQDHNPGNGSEPIEWIVLDTDGKKSLLISRYGLETQIFNEVSSGSKWEDSPLRQWLNREFIDKAFSANEKSAVLRTAIDNGPEQSRDNMSGGNNTTDQIFLLSYAESQKCFASDSDHVCVPTPHVKGETDGGFAWWLRSPGRFGVMQIGYDGRYGSEWIFEKGTVRPAFWLDVELASKLPVNPDSQHSRPVNFDQLFETKGSIVTLGVYEQDNDFSNGPEPIEWIVLTTNGSRSLLISRYGLDVKPYNLKELPYLLTPLCRWENCYLRSWLNTEFRDAAFSQEEKDALIVTPIDNSQKQGYYQTQGGHTTEDIVSILSFYESTRSYLDGSRQCIPTAYAKGKAKPDKDGNYWWWLRSPGADQNSAIELDTECTRFGSIACTNYNIVRPVIFFNQEAEAYKSYRNNKETNSPATPSPAPKPAPTPYGQISSASLFSAQENTFDYVVLPDGTIEITGYHGSEMDLSVPSIIAGKTVTAIGKRAFCWQKWLRTVSLPDSVTRIGVEAFLKCPGLSKIRFSSHLETIENSAFYACESLRSITLPEGLQSLGSSSFSDCKSLEAVSLPDSLQTIGANPFSGCPLTDFVISDHHPFFCTIDHVLFSRQNSTLISYPCGLKQDTYAVPAGTRGIARHAFLSSRIREIQIPASVEVFDDYAIPKNGVFVMVYPETSAEAYCKERGIRYSYFQDAQQLRTSAEDRETPAEQFETEVLPDGTLSIKKYNGTDTDVIVPGKIGGVPVTCIDKNAFYANASLYSLVLPDGIVTIGRYAFHSCIHLEKVSLPNTLKVLGKGAFYDCNALTEICLPESLETVEDYPFYGCTKLTIWVPAGRSFPGIDYGARQAKKGSPQKAPEKTKEIPASAPQTPSPESPDSLPTAGNTNFSVGDVITFGNYPQSAKGIAAPIEWQVLEIAGDEALLISRYALDAKPFHEEFTLVTWEDSTLRAWLNGEFLNRAFTSQEQSAILTAFVDNSDE